MFNVGLLFSFSLNLWLVITLGHVGCRRDGSRWCSLVGRHVPKKLCCKSLVETNAHSSLRSDSYTLHLCR